MDKFERQLEDFDVISAYQVFDLRILCINKAQCDLQLLIDMFCDQKQAMDSTSAMTTTESSVDSLMQQVADKHGLKVADEIQAAPSSTSAIGTLGYFAESSLALT